MAIKQTGVLSKGIKLGYTATLTDANKFKQSSYTFLNDVQSTPAMGGNKDAVEITTLADKAHTFMAGLESYGDAFDFVFLKRPIDTASTSPEADQFATLSTMADSGASYHWAVILPDKLGTDGQITSGATMAIFEGTLSVGLDAAATNGALTYTVSIKPGTAITFGTLALG